MEEDSKRHLELQALRSICDNALPDADRHALLRSLDRHAFAEPEHEIVFQSLNKLLPSGPVSPERLRVHLNNRGFPDTDVEKYFVAAVEPDAGTSPSDESQE